MYCSVYNYIILLLLLTQSVQIIEVCGGVLRCVWCVWSCVWRCVKCVDVCIEVCVEVCMELCVEVF